MRPRRLEVEGFSTFRQRTCLDFDGLELVAFTGATGAGKSTLIDAITFALYGSVARYDNTNRVAPVIHQLANQARVRLDFEAGGRIYIATRVVRRVNTRSGDGDSASTREARLELVDPVDPDAETTVLAGDVKGLNAAVEELLGLDFRQFTRTIVLPQGDFAAFLRDDPSNRDKLLQRLLDLGIYERMGQLARSEAKKCGNQAEVLIQHLQQSPPLSDEEFEALTARVEALQQVRSVIEATLVELGALDARLDPLRQEVQAIDRALARLEPIDIPDDLAGLDRQLNDAGRDREAIETELTQARAARDEAMAARDGLPDKGELVRVQSLGEQLAEAAEKLEEHRAVAAEVEGLAIRLA
ncbi:MAG: SMC family ATPase, partial [Acidimicrobiales bacterium]